MSQPLLINRLVIDFEFPAGKENSEALNIVKEQGKYVIVPLLESILEKYKSHNISIEKLDLDLGTINLNDIPEALGGMVENLFNENSKTITGVKNSQVSENFEQTKREIDILLHFLEHGLLPWYVLKNSEPNINKMLTDAILIPRNVGGRELYQLLKHNNNALQRLLYLIDDNLIIDVIRFFSAHQHSVSETDVKAVEQFINTLVSLPGEISPVSKHNILSFLVTILLTEEFTSSYAVFSELATQVLAYSNVGTTGLYSNVNTPTVINQQNSNFKYITSQILNAAGLQQHELKNTTSKIKITDAVDNDQYENSLPSIFINNGGLVLITRFIPALFNSLGYLTESFKFKSVKHQHRAMHLLQYISGFNGQHHEYLMPFNKILCGVEISTPLIPGFVISKREKDEVNELLTTVIKHWEILADTSVEVFRASFLQRNAVLEKSGADWIVRVEQKGLDVLIDHIPWGFSIIKFEWNKHIIHVEWKTK